MPTKLGLVAAILGSTLIALSLTGSTQAAANSPSLTINPAVAAAISRSLKEGNRQFSSGDYLSAHTTFVATASLAQRAGSLRATAEAFTNAGRAALSRQDFRHAVTDFLNARQSAEAFGDPGVIAITMNNLASAYLTSGEPEGAKQVAEAGLAVENSTRPDIRPGLQVQLATALSRLNRYPDAMPIYRQAVDQLVQQGDLPLASRVLATMGRSGIETGHLDDAEAALDDAFWMIRMHHLPESANVFRDLAIIRSRRGDPRAAAPLFEAAVRTPPLPTTPRWIVYADRGEFRLSQNDAAGALSDFREARRIIALTRADIVPADHDRVAMESGLSRVPAGLADAGNRLALQTSNPGYLDETFDAAEQDRLWSLRALVPSTNDWRTRLPSAYWDLLARYQAAERAYLERPSPALRERAAALRLDLQQLEATAGQSLADEASPATVSPASALTRTRRLLDNDTVLLSFLVTVHGSWLWAVDRSGAAVYPIPSLEVLRSETSAFSLELQKGSPEAAESGRRLYKELFGKVAPSYLSHSRWLLELDGPLFDLPFAALAAGERDGAPVYLAEKVVLEAIPGALLLSSRESKSAAGEMLAVGDAVYNRADERFRATGTSAGAVSASLPRLPGTATEVRECARVWGTSRTRVLTGPDASLAAVESAIASHPSVIHFATHVVSGAGEYSSGFIALSLDRSGALGLLGPAEIVARPVTATLVVLDGCHSAQGQALPAAGLMGLTRAWIGAGAGAVLATRWDIPDDAAQTLIAAFYRNLRAHWERGPAFALHEAQLELLQNPSSRANPAFLAAYFLIGRV